MDRYIQTNLNREGKLTMKECNETKYTLRDHIGKIVFLLRERPWTYFVGFLSWSNDIGKWTVSTNQFYRKFALDTEASITFELLDVERIEVGKKLTIYID